MSNVKKLMMSAAGGAGINVEEVFSAFLYDGDSSSSNTIVNGIDLQTEGGMVWTKGRSAARGNNIWDTARGVRKVIMPDQAGAGTYNETSLSAGLSAFNNNGFTLSGNYYSEANYANTQYVSWTFRKCPKFFDVVTYTGNGTSGRTVAHNLGSVPGCIMIKEVSTSPGTLDFAMYHRGMRPTLGSGSSSSEGYYIRPSNSGAHIQSSGAWNNTVPTDTVFTLGNLSNVNQNNKQYVAYLWAHNDGDGNFGPTGDQDIIKCGRYQGNSSDDGTEVNLGFEPQFVWIKAVSVGQAWVMFDTKRGISTSEDDQVLYTNYTSGEGNPQKFIRVTPTGFKLDTNNYEVNYSGSYYQYIAIRRGPMALPESGADVFKGTWGNTSSNHPPGWSSPTGFTVDMSLDVNVGGGSTDNVTWGARAIQNRYTENLHNQSGNAWYNWDGQTYDHNYGFRDNSNQTSDLGYMWARRTGAFDVATYRGSGQNITVNHNLGGEVGMAWLTRLTNNTEHTWVYARPLGNQGRLSINSDSAASTGETIWQSTHPTENEIYIDSSYAANSSDYMINLFGNLSGISKVDTFTGNGSTINVDCGFTNGVRFVLIKCTSHSGKWYMFNEQNMGEYGYSGPYVILNKSQTGIVYPGNYFSSTSSGFSYTYNTSTDINYNNRTFLYYAVAA